MRTRDLLVPLVVIGSCFVSLVSPGGAQTENRTGKNIGGQGKHWRVEVVSAIRKTQAQLNPDYPDNDPPVYEAKNGLLILRLQFEYLGPSGQVPAPNVTVVDERGKKFSIFGNLTLQGLSELDLMDWLLSATHTTPETHTLKQGDKIGKPYVQYYLEIPNEAKKLKLVFGGEEIPGLVITPTDFKKTRANPG